MSTATIEHPSFTGHDLAAPRVPRPGDAHTVPAPAAHARRFTPELLGLLLLTALLNLVNLGANGWSNTYYSATVRSMTSSWHNFIFASFDPAGVMTVDKPPLALWAQAVSAKVFGFNTWGLLIPQALMGVAAVALLWDLTRRVWGRWPAFVAGATLALTPITVAMSRHNNPDALLTLLCVLALWAIVRALESGRTRWVLLSGLALGLAFETKMAAGLMTMPALAAAYLYASPRGYMTAFKQLLGGGAVALVSGLAWPLLMWITPAAERPWISGTSDNSIWSLILDYNGTGRVAGQSGGPGGMAGGAGGGAAGGPGGGGGGFFGGDTGIWRLFNESLGGQAGWLIVFAVIALVGLVGSTRLNHRDPRTGWVIAAGGSFLTIAYVFSTAQGIFHPYYSAQLAPFTAALVGAGFGLMRSREAWVRLLAASAVAATAFAQIKIAAQYDATLDWLPVALILVALPAAVVLAILPNAEWHVPALAVALAALMLAPAAWSLQTPGHVIGGTFPAGGPESVSGQGPGGRGGPGGAGPGGASPQGMSGPPGMFGGQAPATASGQAPGTGGGQALGTASGPGAFGGGMFGGGDLTSAIEYAQSHGGGTIAVSGQQGASSAIIAGENVAGIGGFSGRESEVSIDWLADRVASGAIRWVSTGGGMGGMRDGRTGSTTAMAAVQQACEPVTLGSASTDTSTPVSMSTATSGSGSGSTATLYDCKGLAGDLPRSG